MSTETLETTLADKAVTLALVATVTSCFVQPAFADVIREVANHTLYSTADPPLRLQIDKKFQYVGSDGFVLKNIANVERHHWIVNRDHAVPSCRSAFRVNQISVSS